MDYLIHIRKTGTAAEFATKVGVARSTFFEYMDFDGKISIIHN